MRPDRLFLLLFFFVVLATLAAPLFAQAVAPALEKAGPFDLIIGELAKAFGSFVEILLVALGGWILAKISGATGWISTDQAAKLEGLLKSYASRAAAWAEEKAARKLKDSKIETKGSEKLEDARRYLVREAREKLGMAISPKRAGELLEGVLPFVNLGATAVVPPTEPTLSPDPPE